jgi:hypothetical protein
LFEGEEETEGGAADGSSVGEVIEIATEETTEEFDARWGPGGEVGEGAVLDLAILAEALAEEGGGGWSRGWVRRRCRCAQYTINTQHIKYYLSHIHDYICKSENNLS